MNPIDTTAPSQTESISFEFDLRHSPAKVWRALTDPELLTQWLLPLAQRAQKVQKVEKVEKVKQTEQLELEPGAAFTFQAPPQPGWDGAVKCRFVEIEVEKKLSWAWVVGDIDTVVTFTLTPTATGTLLSLVQSGFKPDQKKNFGGARYGWKMMGGKLVDLLERTP